MKAITELMTTPWMEALGWSLLHSIWQGLLICVLVWIALRFINQRLSQLRYIVCAGGLLLTLATIAVTFIFLLSDIRSEQHVQHPGLGTSLTETTSPAPSSGFIETSTTLFVSVIESNMPWILACWIAGACLFMLRIFGGWVYLLRIKNQAVLIHNEWSNLLNSLATQLGINRVIRLAESTSIQVPVVVGYLKPVVLVPVGMFSGLTTEQIETIFLHELAHIKRHDFLVNLIQTIIESILFFNPFVWILSNLMRQEREYCCDDAVISKQEKALAYACALAKLEEVRLGKNVLALSLAGNKNQLLNRIKRIMEKSVKSHSGAEKIVPVLLIIAGLTCASWITIQTKGESIRDQSQEIQNDTTKKNKEGRYYYSKRIVTNENGEPVEEIIERYDGDEDLRPIIAPIDVMASPDLADLMVDVPAAPDMMIDIPEIPDVMIDIQDIPAIDPIIAPFPPNTFWLDTTKRSGYRFRDHQQWKQFSEEFEKTFKERFKDFYEKNEKDIAKMMEEMSRKFESDFNSKEWARLEKDLHAYAADVQRQAELAHATISDRAWEQAAQAEVAAREVEAHVRRQMEQQRKNEIEMLKGQLDMQRDDLKQIEKNLRDLEENMKAFEKELKEQLIKDGYIEKGESINHMQWDDDGEFTINDKAIKQSDRKKYTELHRKYFKDQPGSFHFVE